VTTIALALDDDADVLPTRPSTRADCVNGERPCPFVGCRHHLYLDVRKNGTLHISFPDLEVGELAETCSLDVADAGPESLEHIGNLTNLTRERIRQIEETALMFLPKRHLQEFAGDVGRERHHPIASAIEDGERSGSGAGVAETTESWMGDRGADLDLEAAFRERVWATYERTGREAALACANDKIHVYPPSLRARRGEENVAVGVRIDGAPHAFAPSGFGHGLAIVGDCVDDGIEWRVETETSP
jgi:hypothetical protein